MHAPFRVFLYDLHCTTSIPSVYLRVTHCRPAFLVVSSSLYMSDPADNSPALTCPSCRATFQLLAPTAPVRFCPHCGAMIGKASASAALLQMTRDAYPADRASVLPSDNQETVALGDFAPLPPGQ